MIGRLLCALGFHRWEELGHTVWMAEPSVFRNELGLAMEYRACARGCPAITDQSMFKSSADPDYGVPNGLGPLAWKRAEQIKADGYKPLPAEPLPIQEGDDR